MDHERVSSGHATGKDLTLGLVWRPDEGMVVARVVHGANLRRLRNRKGHLAPEAGKYRSRSSGVSDRVTRILASALNSLGDPQSSQG